MDFIGGEARGGANRVAIGVFDMGKMDAPVVLVFVTDHGEHLSHSMIDAFDASVTTGLTGARGELMYPEQFVDGGR